MTEPRIPPSPPRPAGFLDGGGEAARMIRERDWSSHPLGPPETWPETLRVALGLVLNSSESMILAWGPELTFFFNDTYFPLLGPRLSWAMGARFEDVWADAWEQAKPIIAEAFAGRSTRYVDLPWKLATDRGAQDTWWTFSYSRVLDGDGAVAGLFILTNETTGRVVGEAERRATDSRNRQILDSAIDFAIMATDRDGRITRWNEGARRVLGWSEAEMLGETAERLFTPEDVAGGRIEAEMRRAAERGRAGDERWHLRKGGARFWANGKMTPIRDAEGHVTGFVKVLRDRTDERLAEDALRQAEAQLRRAQEAGGIGVFWVRVEDDRLHPTAAFCALYGLPVRDSYPAAAFERLIVAEDAGLVSDAPARRRGTVRTDVEYRIRRADTGALRWIARRGDIERDPDGRPLRFVGVARDITEQVAMRQALAAEREQLAQMFEQAPTFMALLRGPEHRIERVNPGYTRLIGGRQVVGKTVAEALPDAVAQGHLDLLDSVYRDGKPFAATGSRYAVQAVAGGAIDERFVDFVYQPLRDARGDVYGIFVEGVDVTDRAETTAALEASEDRYRSLFTAIDAGFCVIEVMFDAAGHPADYRFLETNPAFAAQTGLENAVGRTMRALAPTHEQHWFDTYGRVARTGEAVRFEDEAAALGRHYEVHAYRVGPPDAHRVAILFTDITARKQVEAALRQLNATLEQRVEERTADRNRMWQLSTDIMLVADFEARIVSVNPAWTDLFGWSAAELIGRSFMDLVHPDDRAATLAEVGTLAAGLKTLRFENRYQGRDGTFRWISWTAVPDARFIHAVGRDVEAEKQAAQALRKTEEQLRQSQKMEAVGQLTGGIAHDFNNLLTGIAGSLDLLTARIAQGRLHDVERYTAAAQGAARRAAALTHRLLAFSRQQTLDPKPTDVNRLIADMEDLIRRTVGPSVEIDTEAAGDLWPTLVDPGQLENALLNLCINARDAMPTGGRIVIETANHSLDAAAAAAHDMPPGHYVAMCVRDTGTGMTPEVAARAFDPFFTTKPLGQGTGLGLSMIYGFARQSGGQVRIASELGRGTRVCVYLPRHVGQAEAADQRPPLPDAPRAGAGETVLVVDDEPSVRMLVTETLEDLGYAAIEAADSPSGLKVLQSDVRIDLLVTDVGLPGGMNGRQMVDAARLSRPDLKVLFITGYAETSVLGDAHREPGLHVMTKPFAMEALASRIKALIAGG